MDIDEEINEDKDIEDIYDDESDSFAPEDINDELEKNTNISESEVCKNKFSNNIIVSNNDSNYHHYLYNIKLSDENIIEEKIDKYYSFKESPVIDFENYLSKDIENIYLKMSPLELFMFMFDEYIIKIVEYSKLFASHRYNSNNLGINKDDIYIYFYIYIFLSVYKYSELEMLWEENDSVATIIPSLISRKRYREINKYISISKNYHIYTKNNFSNNEKKLSKINEFVEYMNNKWKKIYPYTKYITIDESICSYRGVLCFRQYLKDKHKKYGIKFFSKASSNNGYIYHTIPYTGKEFEYDKKIGIGTCIIIEMAKGHENKSFHFTFDNYYSNIYSFYYLYKNNIDFTCTFNQNKKGFPNKIKNIVLSKGEEKLYNINHTNIKLFMTKDKKQINVASSCYGAQKYKYKNKRGKWKYKNEIICYYNKTKGGVDLVDCFAEIYKTQRKTYKWWKSLLFYFIDITIHNCSIVYNYSNNYHKVNNNNSSLFFRKVLLSQFVSYFRSIGKNIEIKNKIKIVKEIHILVKIENGPKSCENCKKNKNIIGKNYKRTNFKCNKCNLVLCEECFYILHNNIL